MSWFVIIQAMSSSFKLLKNRLEAQIRLGVKQLLKCGVEESGVDVEFGIGEEEVVVVWCDA